MNLFVRMCHFRYSLTEWRLTISFRFSNQLSTGVYINDTTIMCPAPAGSCASYPCNVTVEVALGELGYTFNRINFTYYKGIEANTNRKEEK